MDEKFIHLFVKTNAVGLMGKEGRLLYPLVSILSHSCYANLGKDIFIALKTSKLRAEVIDKKWSVTVRNFVLHKNGKELISENKLKRISLQIRLFYKDYVLTPLCNIKAVQE
jgi:hypothetical protein